MKKRVRGLNSGRSLHDCPDCFDGRMKHVTIYQLKMMKLSGVEGL